MGDAPMKRLIYFVLTILFFVVSLFSVNQYLEYSSGESSEGTLTIYNWGDYIDPTLIKEFEAELQQYPNLKEIVWVQDEPQNQGPWFYIQHHIYQNMSAGQKLSYAGRAASSSPAVGYLALHNEQLKSLLEQAFSPRLRGFTLTK